MHTEWDAHFQLEFIGTRAKISDNLFKIPGRPFFHYFQFTYFKCTLHYYAEHTNGIDVWILISLKKRNG